VYFLGQLLFATIIIASGRTFSKESSFLANAQIHQYSSAKITTGLQAGRYLFVFRNSAIWPYVQPFVRLCDLPCCTPAKDRDGGGFG